MMRHLERCSEASHSQSQSQAQSLGQSSKSNIEELLEATKLMEVRVMGYCRLCFVFFRCMRLYVVSHLNPSHFLAFPLPINSSLSSHQRHEPDTHSATGDNPTNPAHPHPTRPHPVPTSLAVAHEAIPDSDKTIKSASPLHTPAASFKTRIAALAASSLHTHPEVAHNAPSSSQGPSSSATATAAAAAAAAAGTTAATGSHAATASAPDEPHNPTPAEIAAAIAQLSPPDPYLRVLLVEDSVPVQKMMVAWLEGMQCEVCVAENGRSALTEMKSAHLAAGEWTGWWSAPDLIYVCFLI